MASQSSSTDPGPARRVNATSHTPEAPGQSVADSAAEDPLRAPEGPDPKQAAAAESSPEQAEDSERESPEQKPKRRLNRFLVFAALPSWLVSSIVHALALLVLALMTFGPERNRLPNTLIVAEKRDEPGIEESPEKVLGAVSVDSLDLTPMQGPAEAPLKVEDIQLNDSSGGIAESLQLNFSEKTVPKRSLLEEIGGGPGSGLTFRSAAARGEMLKRGGGTPESEAAVAAALAWLAEHQLPDGGWSFNLQVGRCHGRCPDEGFLGQVRNAATAMALLPFLGSGETHKQGNYKETVRRGLYYLTANMRIIGKRGDLSEKGGYMYSHGLGAIVLCEAYAMTRDKELMRPAQFAINHIVYAQDPVGGGWRYSPQEPGDTSVVGWQLMALKSAHLAYLRVPRETVIDASRFLDSVQIDGGALYGYRRPEDRGMDDDLGTTAVGLLCRMYLGWERDNAALQRGVALLSQVGPSEENMYYNYYATQVMRHFEGEYWEKWNNKMRDYLVATQAKRGHMTGSWNFPSEPLRGDRGAMHGGRLYFTSLATMILEVYYRHMPIYGKQAVEEDFPL